MVVRDYKETDYMKKGWKNNVQNCNIDESRCVMISDDLFEAENKALEAGLLIGRMELEKQFIGMSSCGKWHWLEFENQESAVAFKIMWDV